MKRVKKLLSLLLCAVMALGLVPFAAIEAQAAELPTAAQFATADQLKGFDTDDTNGQKPAAKVYFGNNNQQWWIAGEESGKIVLFAASPLASVQFNVNGGEKPYNASWGCTYPSISSMTGKQVYANHYGGSDIRNGNKTADPENPGLVGLLESCFTEAERSLMKDTTVYTDDTANKDTGNNPLKYSTTDKLYLADSAGEGPNYKHVTVGARNNLRIDKTYWGSSIFWLRASVDKLADTVLVAAPDDYVFMNGAGTPHSVVPAFNFNLSNVLFASAALPATADGVLTVKTVNDVNQEGAFTLRHKSTDVGDAKTGKGNVCVSISNVSTNPAVNTYLVAQNSEGAWAKKVSNGNIIFADELSPSLTSFEKCKVWLETTDGATRITSAKMAEEAATQSSHNVKVKLGDHMSITSNNGRQTGVSGPIGDITVTAENGYYFPTNYSVTPVNGISVSKTSDTTLKISGTPTADTLLTLTAATAQTKADKPAVNISKTATSITVTVTNYNSDFGDIEYKWDGGEFEKNKKTLSNLQADTKHTLAVRFTGSDSYQASDEYSMEGITTLKDGNAVIAVPGNLTAVYKKGLKLSEVALPAGWSWVNGDTPLSEGAGSYPAAFDTAGLESTTDFSGVEGYNPDTHKVTRSVKVTVNPQKETGNTQKPGGTANTGGSGQAGSRPAATGGQKQSNIAAPRTGDNSGMELWLALVAVSLAGAGGAVWYSRKKH